MLNACIRSLPLPVLYRSLLFAKTCWTSGGDAQLCNSESMKNQYDFGKGKRGAVVSSARGKSRITIRLDDKILDWFRREVHEAGGGNYQTLINHALRDYIKKRPESLEEVVRRVVREEVRKSA